jgi:hypothetical protein
MLPSSFIYDQNFGGGTTLSGYDPPHDGDGILVLQIDHGGVELARDQWPVWRGVPADCGGQL